MIQQVSHAAPGAGAADLALALGVAYALHGPVTRAAEVAGAGATATLAPPAARRTAPARTGASRTDAPRTAASRGARRRTRPARRAA
ncbi:hypothetical protein [Streptomyces galbus]|uniref:Uncharacterized protein n=1 Tax=Streptomyces galbus TaxID=33898 RepID=A0ABX1IQ41_STRGB|nr:hypothetical protein [Streptomyces galbus]NKQ27547.1 hypothetical protein [Streptomyces galbus]